MRILKLHAENIKKLIVADITPDKHVVKITGKNAAGKTSLIDSVEWALGGTKHVQDQPIRNGESQALVTLDLGELTVERRFTAKGSTLFVKNSAGTKLKSPQAVLDKLLGALCFDPVKFMKLDRKKQLEHLKNILGLDFSEQDEKYADIFTRRTEATRTLTQLESQLNAIEVHPDTPSEHIEVSQLMDDLNQANDNNNTIATIEKDIADKIKEERKIAAQIAELEMQYKHATKTRQNMAIQLAALQAIDVTDITQRINSAETLNGYLNDKESADALALRISKGSNVIEGLTQALDDISEYKSKTLSKAELPVLGLSFDTQTVTFNGIPLDQASHAEQLRVSVAMAVALNPTLRIIHISDGSTLDRDSMAIIEQIAIQHDYQIWIEVVDDSGEIGVYIEDGLIPIKKHCAA